MSQAQGPKAAPFSLTSCPWPRRRTSDSSQEGNLSVKIPSISRHWCSTILCSLDPKKDLEETSWDSDGNYLTPNARFGTPDLERNKSIPLPRVTQ